MLPPPPRVLRIYPNRLAAEHAGARRAAGCRTSDADITFDELFATLGAMPGWRSIDTWGSRFVVRGLLVASKGRLSAAATDPWGVRATHQALMELRLAGVTSKQLAQPVKGGVPEPLADFKDLTALLGAYEDALESCRLHDAADTQRQAVYDVVTGQLPPPWAALERIDVVAGTELFGARLDILNAFAARGVGVEVTVPWDEARPHAFAWPEAMLHALEARGHQRLRVRYDARCGEGDLQALRGAQFAGRKVDGTSVRLLQVADGDEHRQQILGTVVGWLRAGVPAHAIAVVTPDSAMGLPLVHHLTRAGVPAFCRRGAPLGQSRAANVVLGALDAIENGLPREAFADLWLVCGRPVVTDEGPWSPPRVVAELRRLRVRTCEPGAVRAAWLADGARGRVTAAAIDAVTAALDGFATRLLALPLETNVEAGLVALVELLVDAVPTDAASADATAAAFLQVRQSLLQLMQATRVAPKPAALGRAELMDWLRLLFDEQRQAPPGVRSGAVRIMGPDEMVGSRFERVFVVGANVGVFPRLAPADPVLTDMLRHAINGRLGPRLIQYGPLSGRGALPGDARDTWLWLEILASCQRELVVSCAPGEDDAGPSELVDELMRSTQMPLTTPPVSYTASHPAAMNVWMQAWALGHPRRGLSNESALPWHAVDGALAHKLPERHGRVRSAMATLWERQDNGGQLPLLSAAAQPWVEEGVLGRVQSTSRLDALGMCRYKHFASGLLHLRQDDVTTLSANAREQGSVAHAGLYVVYRDLLQRGGMREARLRPEATLARAKEVYWQEPARLLQDTAIHPLLHKATLLHAWQAVETQLQRDLRATDGEPIALEYRFDDRPDANANARLFELPHPDGKRVLKVRGSIDRVDACGDTLQTLDYKRTLKARTLGRHFQLAIYGAVAQRDLQPHAAAVSAAWLGLWDGKRKDADGLEGGPHAMVDYLNDFLWPRVEALLGGAITPDPDGEELCDHCEFAPLCRVPSEGGVEACD